jgi:hypothetical protein
MDIADIAVMPVMPDVLIEKIIHDTRCRWTAASFATTCKDFARSFGPDRFDRYPRVRAAAVHIAIRFSLRNERRQECETFEFNRCAQDPLAPEPKIDASLTILVYSDRIAFMRRRNGRSEVIENIGIFRFKSLEFTADEMFAAIKAKKRAFVREQITAHTHIDKRLPRYY